MCGANSSWRVADVGHRGIASTSRVGGYPRARPLVNVGSWYRASARGSVATSGSIGWMLFVRYATASRCDAGCSDRGWQRREAHSALRNLAGGSTTLGSSVGTRIAQLTRTAVAAFHARLPASRHRACRLTTACSRRPSQSSNLHTQICRLSGARLMLAVRRHRRGLRRPLAFGLR